MKPSRSRDESKLNKSSQARNMRRRQQQDAAGKDEKLVEAVNSLPAEDFFATFCPKNTIDTITQSCKKHNLRAIYKDASELKGSLLGTCLRLIQETSAEDYQTSEMKWSSAKKRKEMALPDMKYILLVDGDPTDSEQKIAGFISFMITYEDGNEVLYVYEIHFPIDWQSHGLGRMLMNTVEQIGETVGIKKVMLTVFKTNGRAVKWYDHLGYIEDEFSPAPRKLRNGTVKEASYLILSKVVNSS